MSAFNTSYTSQATSELAGRIARNVAMAINAVAEWNDARITRKSLAQLSDRELDDIGLTRSDIDAVTSLR